MKRVASTSFPSAILIAHAAGRSIGLPSMAPIPSRPVAITQSPCSLIGDLVEPRRDLGCCGYEKRAGEAACSEAAEHRPISIARSPPEAPPLAPVRRPRSASARWLCDGRRPRRPTSSGLERRATLGPARALRGEVPAAIAFPLHGAAKESNLPSAGLPRPAGFEDEWLLAFFVALSGDFGRTSPGARWSLRWHALRGSLR